ncbi:MAG TPA: hypothetical protein VKU41_10790 [Polyangiaceae bacterium]|nr:hypothetical protein [Polyangiaceae bacterium]
MGFMRRRMVIALLAVGTVVGYASGFAHMAHHHGRTCCPHHAESP